MDTVILWILGIATFVGGIAAVHYFYGMWRNRQRWTVEEKEVNSTWWESSGLKQQYEADGYKDFRWSNADKVAERMASGMEVVYEVDTANRVKFKLVNSSGQVLLGRSDNE